MKLTKYEQETIISFNAGEKDAELFTRDKAVIRQMDDLVKRFPDLYKQIGQTSIDKTYSFPKSCVSYRKPRKISEAKREQARSAMKRLNSLHKFL
jgi:hypothetical protein